MRVEFDAAKDATNRVKHGLSLADAAEFDFEGAVVLVDDRFDYGETRYRAFVRNSEGGLVLAFTLDSNVLRPISFRRAHDKELRRYGL